jgi:hypothetical protein
MNISKKQQEQSHAAAFHNAVPMQGCRRTGQSASQQQVMRQPDRDKARLDRGRFSSCKPFVQAWNALQTQQDMVQGLCSPAAAVSLVSALVPRLWGRPPKGVVSAVVWDLELQEAHSFVGRGQGTLCEFSWPTGGGRSVVAVSQMRLPW